MNEKDYQEIARIIKHWIVLHDVYGHIIDRDNFVDELADYFEKETENKKCKCGETMFNGDGEFIKVFNRKQFLKECGVE